MLREERETRVPGKGKIRDGKGRGRRENGKKKRSDNKWREREVTAAGKRGKAIRREQVEKERGEKRKKR